MLRQNWNFNWTFCPEGGVVEKVDLPHDAMIFEDRIPQLKNGSQTGYFPGGKYIYTKILDATDDLLKKTVVLEFEGVYQKSTVYLNGEKVGGRVYGYSRFYVDLTGKLKAGANEIKVVADNTQVMNSRWYSGSGIYRDVNLYVGEASHIDLDGVRIVTKSYDPAVLEVEIAATALDGMELVTEIAYGGKTVARGSGARCEIAVPNAKLWNCEEPHLYDVTVKLLDGDKVVDTYQEKYGIRIVTFDTQNGMQVNGQGVKLRGACIHHDHGPIGARSFKTAELRRVRILKEAGFNAIRCAHNPYSRAFLEACDELGMYVLHETFDTWINKKSDYDYALYFEDEYEKDVRDMILMSRDHACVIIYGIGNEIFETGSPQGGEISRKLVSCCKKYDPTRPVINCLNPLCTSLASTSNTSKTTKDDVVDPRAEALDLAAAGSKLANNLVTMMPAIMPILGSAERIEKMAIESMEAVDMVGFNYATYIMEPMNRLHDNWILMGSETYPHAICDNWPLVEKYSWNIGDFCWTGWDYLGETGIGYPLYGVKEGPFNKPYPCVAGGCGSVDITGQIGAQAEYSKTVWGLSKTPYIGVRPVDKVGRKVFMGQWRNTDAINNWTWKNMDGHAAEIEIFSNGATVALYQDGNCLGKKRVKKYKAIFKTTYKPGELEAVAYDASGKEIGRSSLRSAGEETVLAVTPETASISADGMDLAYFVVNIADKEGNVKLLEDRLVTVQVEGAGELIGIGSARVETRESFIGNTCTTYEGRLIAIVRSNGQKGQIKLTASTEELTSVSAMINAE